MGPKHWGSVRRVSNNRPGWRELELHHQASGEQVHYSLNTHSQTLAPLNGHYRRGVGAGVIIYSAVHPPGQAAALGGSWRRGGWRSPSSPLSKLPPPPHTHFQSGLLCTIIDSNIIKVATHSPHWSKQMGCVVIFTPAPFKYTCQYVSLLNTRTHARTHR